MANDQGKCAHPGCQCTVQSSQTYCSTYCAQQGQQSSQLQQQAQSSTARRCNCGHAACQHS
jgi:hypothetical protein